MFTTAVGHSSKRTLAAWHVTSPEEVVGHLLHLVRGEADDGDEGADESEGERGAAAVPASSHL